MRGRIIQLMLVISLLLASLVPNLSAGVDSLRQNFRDGFLLEPQMQDSTGVSVDSDFLLTSKNPVELDVLKKGFSIDNEPSPSIKKINETKFLITPSRKLLENKLYTFTLNHENKTSWTFQTRASFNILGSLPRNEATNVPINTGIEIGFTHSNVKDLEQYFDIEPSVEGEFKDKDKTAVFVPSSDLDYSTIYTVTINKDLKIKGTDRTLEEDFIFEFETSAKQDSQTSKDIWKGNVSFGKPTYNFSTAQELYLPLSYNMNRDYVKSDHFSVDTKVYAFDSFKDYKEDYIKFKEMPVWATRAREKTRVSPDNLSKVLEFEQEFKVRPDGSDTKARTLHIPSDLSKGYYLVDSVWDDVKFQALIQVTDVNAFVSTSKTKNIAWLNDMISREPVENAEITFAKTSDVLKSNADGIVAFDAQKNQEEKDALKRNFMTVKTKDDFNSIFSIRGYNRQNQEHYWRHFQIDRKLYQPNDTLNLWGFVQNMYKNENIKDLKLEITSRQYHSFGSTVNAWGRQPSLIRKNIDVNNGFFNGQIDLPMLEQGHYDIMAKHNGEQIFNTSFEVQEYETPAYKLSLSKDKEAIFLNEPVNFDVKTSFFEGTSVPHLDTNIIINDHSIGGRGKRLSDKTDIKGNLSYKYVPEVNGDMQGERSVTVNARATLPEIADISDSKSVRVFTNDIDVDLEARIKDSEGFLNAKVSNIVLDRINDGSAKNRNDYLGDALGSKRLNLTIYKSKWVREKTGVNYDFINKVTRNTYRYYREETPINDSAVIVTDENGEASFNLSGLDTDEYNYFAKVTCNDTNGRKMEFRVNFREAYETTPWSYNDNKPDDRVTLEGGLKDYSLEDNIELEFRRGLESLSRGSYLYIIAQNGIKDYVVSKSPEFSMPFERKHMPNTFITGVYLDENGIIHVADFNAVFRYDKNKLDIKTSFDKQEYRPGQTARISIEVRDKDKNPIEATVNARIIDEAFLTLKSQNIDVLSDLFIRVRSGIYYNQSSHDISFGEDYWDLRYMEDAEISLDMEAGMVTSKMSNMSAPSDAPVRENFQDTAYFQSITTDEDGRGEFIFELPDNVTKWRVSLDAISNDIYAGSVESNMITTLPFFINHSLNTTYLVGDEPVIGLNAYGDALKEDDLVMFEVTSSSDSRKSVSAVGKAFERVNISLWEMEEGIDDLVIRAYTNNNLGDAVSHSIEVVSSYYKIGNHTVDTLRKGMSFDRGASGSTRLIFTDEGRGQFLNRLLRIARGRGHRIDQKVSAKVSQDILNEYFEGENFSVGSVNDNIKDYQVDGGMALMVYSDNDIELTAKLAPYIEDKVDINALKLYFYNQYEKQVTSRMPALMGLASLGEPVLLDLEKYYKVDNMSIKDTIYLALAFYEIGEEQRANEIFQNRLKPLTVESSPYIYIQSDTSKDTSIELTMLLSLLASKINAQESQGLYEYIKDNNPENIFIGLEEAIFIKSVIDGYESKAASFKYQLAGKDYEIDLASRWSNSYSLELPSKLIENVSIKQVEGEISVISMFEESLDTLDTLDGRDENLNIKRQYYHLNGTKIEDDELKQGDVIIVKLTATVDNKGLDGQYQVMDYLPSGLRPISENIGRSFWHRTYRQDRGQEVRFTMYNWGNTSTTNTFEYRARVISPGTYNAQGSIIQNVKAPKSINWAEDKTLVISSDSENILTPLDPNRIKVNVREHDVIFDVQPILRSGRTLVPMRSIFEVLDVDVDWEESTSTITAKKEDTKVELNIGSDIAKVNGEQIKLDVPAKLTSGRTMVPARFISESLGNSVNWEQETRTVIVN